MWLLDYLHKAVAVLPTLASFAVCMMLIVSIPRLSRRVHLPEAVGLLLAGMLFGPHVLDIFSHEHPVLKFFAEVGALLLMFFAGLELDLTLFRQKIFGALGFGVITTSLPLLLGMLVTLWLGYALLPAIVVGSLIASHTMLGSTIIARLGARNREPMVVTFGATMVSDTLSLLVFAACLPLYTSGQSAGRQPHAQRGSHRGARDGHPRADPHTTLRAAPARRTAAATRRRLAGAYTKHSRYA